MKVEFAVVAGIAAACVLAACGGSGGSPSGGISLMPPPRAAAWVFEDYTDKLTGNPGFHALRKVSLDGGGSAELEVVCGGGVIKELAQAGNAFMKFDDLKGYTITVALFGPDNKPLDLDPASINQQMGQFRASVAAGKESSLLVTSRHSNEFEVSAMSGPSTSLFALSGMKFMAPSALASASLFKVEAPLVGGRKEVVDFHPQEGGFQTFVSRCTPPTTQRAGAAAATPTAAAAAPAPPVSPPSPAMPAATSPTTPAPAPTTSATPAAPWAPAAQPH